MKNRKWIIALIVFLSVIMVIVSVFFVSLLRNGFKMPNLRWNLQVSDELIVDKTYEEAFNRIVIDSTAGEIHIKRSSTEDVKAVVYGDKDSTLVETKNHVLKVEFSKQIRTGFHFIFNQKSAKIEIELPADYSGEIHIKNNYGNIIIDEFLDANIDIEEDCGNVEVVGGNIVNVNNNYGDITIGKANIANINEECGDVKVSHVNDITVENSYGDIEIKTVNNYLNLENDCGDIEVKNLNINKDSYIKSDLGDIELGNTNEIFIDAKTDLGDVKIQNNYNKSDITLKIKNDCGDIEVNN